MPRRHHLALLLLLAPRTACLTSIGLAVAAATACRVPADMPAGSGARPASDVAATAANDSAAALVTYDRWNGAAGRSAIALTVRWPDRGILALPASTTRVEFTVYPMGETGALLQRTVDRPSGQATTSVELSPLPPTPVVLSAIGRDSTGAAVAAGGAFFDLRPNARAKGNVTLQATATASVSGFHPPAALPGQRVAVFGSGFGEAGTRGIAIGERALSADKILRLSWGITYFDVPADTGSGPVVVAGATSSATFATIRSISLAASGSTDLFLRDRRDLEYLARDASGSTLSVPVRDLPW
ncbi:MAG: hypothetical protein FJZ00_11285, partial [Candidatus Sericytochromatia bacterium]|nr:hypothetical protein [Candidatus Tanganyikabacteria bacterium]